jgi:hypothetical protein
VSAGNGGQAFPLSVAVSPQGDEHVAYEGMSLRDYFAIRCLPHFFFTGSPEIRAKAAYAEADAMLAERAK